MSIEEDEEDDDNSSQPEDGAAEEEDLPEPKKNLEQFLKTNRGFASAGKPRNRKSSPLKAQRLLKLGELLAKGTPVQDIMAELDISEKQYQRYRSELSQKYRKALTDNHEIQNQLILAVNSMETRLNNLIYRQTAIAENEELHPGVRQEAEKMIAEAGFAVLKLLSQGPAVIKMFSPNIQLVADGKELPVTSPKPPALKSPEEIADPNLDLSHLPQEQRIQSAAQRRMREMMSERAAAERNSNNDNDDMPLGDDDEIDDGDDDDGDDNTAAPLSHVYDGYNPEEQQQQQGGGEPQSQVHQDQKEASFQPPKEDPAES